MDKLPKAWPETKFDRGKYVDNNVKQVMKNDPLYILWLVEHKKMYEFPQTVIDQCIENYFGVAIFVG